MYDELARAQNPGKLERFVVNALIPSVLLTFVLHEPSVAKASLLPPAVPALSTPPFVFIGTECYPLRVDLPDVFPVLVSMPHVVYPSQILRSDVKGRVLLKALVNVAGRVDPASIQLLRATDVRLVAPARRALIAVRFRPAWRAGRPIPAWITIGVTT